MKGHKVEAGSGLVDNLASLTSLDEQSLLEEIRTRYHSNIIYVSMMLLWQLPVVYQGMQRWTIVVITF